MQIVSEIIKIPFTKNISTEYVEAELKKSGIIPLRWAITDINNDYFTINCAYSC